MFTDQCYHLKGPTSLRSRWIPPDIFSSLDWYPDIDSCELKAITWHGRIVRLLVRPRLDRWDNPMNELLVDNYDGMENEWWMGLIHPIYQLRVWGTSLCSRKADTFILPWIDPLGFGWDLAVWFPIPNGFSLLILMSSWFYCSWCN